MKQICLNSINDIHVTVSCLIQFTYTPKYPDELPVIEIASSENLDDGELEKLVNLMKEQVTISLNLPTKIIKE